MPADDLQPLVGYPWWVTVIGLGLIALAIGIVAVVLLVTRRPRTDQSQPAPQYVGVLEQQRATQQVLEVVTRYETNALDARGAHLELAAVLRDYASLRLGRDVTSLTATELRTMPHGRRHIASETGATLESYLAPAFSGRHSPRDAVNEAARRARMVIDRW
jgi:hypothetical protein